MTVLRMQAVRPNHAVLVLVFVTLACGQDHQMLTENCNWGATNWVKTTRGSNVTLSSPSVDLVTNLICRTRFYINDASYTLKMRVRRFDLKGSNDCHPYSEMITLQISETDESKNIFLCGAMYAEELFLPVQAVNLIYNTGASGKGAGFKLEFSAVPQGSCYEERKLEATTQPRLLYSPNFPGHYKSYLSCDVQLYAKKDQYIHIQSQLMQIENSPNCTYDALVINNVRYCGQDPIDIIIPASDVDIKFHTDESKEMDGFILKYEALPTVFLNCTAKTILPMGAASFNVVASNQTSVVVMENHFSFTGSKSFISPRCAIWLDSGSADAVLDVVFLSNLSDVEFFSMSVSGEKDVLHSGKLTINFTGPRPFQNFWKNTLNYLRSPGKNVILNVPRQTEKFMFSVQAVNKDSLPQRVLARSSLVWVSAAVARSTKSQEMFVMPARSGENVEVGVFYTDQDHDTFDPEADRLPVASYAMVYNGEDTSYFELTKGCATNTSSQDRSVYSIKSQNVTVVIKWETTSRGFWMYFAPSDGSYLPQPEELSSSFEFFMSVYRMNVKNLYCKWTVSASSQLDITRNGQFIRLLSASNFEPGNPQQSFIVKEGLTSVMSYTRETPRLWMYSTDPISIIVSVFDSAADLQYLDFRFRFEVLSIGTDVQAPFCHPKQLQAIETVQFAATPNYPDFFRPEPCEWTIVQTTQPGRRGNIVVAFSDLSKFPCSEGHEFQITTINTDGGSFVWPKVCNVSSFRQSYQSDQVKIVFSSRNPYLLPGFNFIYYAEVPLTMEVTLLATKKFQFLSSPNYPSDYPSMTDYQWHITSGSDSRVIGLDLVEFVLEEEIQTQCVHDYLEIYDGASTSATNKIKTMCGRVSNGLYTSTASDLIVVFHSDEQNNYKGFKFQYRSKEKELNVPACGQNITGIIIGVISGGIVFILVVIGVIIYLLRRRRKQRTSSHIRVPVPFAGRQGPVSQSDNSVFIMYGAPISPGYAPPSYWEIQNNQSNNEPPLYSTIHDSGGHVLPEYTPGYTCEQPGINLLELPPPYSNLRLDASRLESSTSLEDLDMAAQPDVDLSTLTDSDDCHVYDTIDNSIQDNSSAENNTATANITQVTDNQISEPPPAYESGSYVQITGGHRHDPRRVPHIKNDRLGYL